MLGLVVASALSCTCGAEEGDDARGSGGTSAVEGPWDQGVALQAEEQQGGDPQDGRRLLLGSVPTVELVLNSKARPDVWRRVDLDSTHFDEEALGWSYEVVEGSQADAPAEEQKYIYDTSHFSQANAGHTFGDHLTDAERRAVIEYLKTL